MYCSRLYFDNLCITLKSIRFINLLTVSEDHKRVVNSQTQLLVKQIHKIESQETIFNSLSQEMSTLQIEHEEMKKSLLDVVMFLSEMNETFSSAIKSGE